MATLSRPDRDGERGQAIVELALTLPLLLLVILGVFDFGLMFQRYEVVTNAAREAARVAILTGQFTTTDAENHAASYLAAGGVSGGSVAHGLCASPAPGDVCVNVTCSQLLLPTTPPKTVQVMVATVTYAHEHVFVGPIIRLFGGSLGTVSLTGVSQMRGEGQTACGP